MSRFNRKCILCGKSYRFCSDCREESDQPAWKNIYCSENCRTIFNTCVEFAQNHISKEEAKAILEKCDLSEKDNYRADLRETVNKILEPVISPAIAADPVDVATEEIAEILEKSTEKAPAEPKKKNRRRN